MFYTKFDKNSYIIYIIYYVVYTKHFKFAPFFLTSFLSNPLLRILSTLYQEALSTASTRHKDASSMKSAAQKDVINLNYFIIDQWLVLCL